MQVELVMFMRKVLKSFYNSKYYCPCVNFLNGRRQNIELIREHVLCDGFLKSYTIWTWHGEVLEQYSSVSATECEYSNLYSEDCMEDMICDIGEDSWKSGAMRDYLWLEKCKQNEWDPPGIMI